VNIREGPLRSLWKSGSTVPKLSPADSTSTSAILAKLKLKNPENNFTEKESSTFKISFDVYLPSIRLRKSIPKLPNYRVVVCRSDSKVPSTGDVRLTLGTLKDGVPLLFSIVSLSNISFFCFSQVSLPTQPAVDES
jgi:hypothetical protein